MITTGCAGGRGACRDVERLRTDRHPTLAAPGTIRGDLGRDWGTAVQQNLVHGSDSTTSAVREIGIWFPGL